jgi:lysophospholipase L1-like esterase
VPILLVEDRTYSCAALLHGRRDRNLSSRAELKRAFDRLAASGIKNLHYLKGDALLGDDGEGTVDGSHPTDLGMMRYAGALAPALRAALSGRHRARGGRDG